MTDVRQWVQPLFMVYDKDTDVLVPLTQARLDELLAVDRTYGAMVTAIDHERLALMRRLEALVAK